MNFTRFLKLNRFGHIYHTAAWSKVLQIWVICVLKKMINIDILQTSVALIAMKKYTRYVVNALCSVWTLLMLNSMRKHKKVSNPFKTDLQKKGNLITCRLIMRWSKWFTLIFLIKEGVSIIAVSSFIKLLQNSLFLVDLIYYTDYTLFHPVLVYFHHHVCWLTRAQVIDK